MVIGVHVQPAEHLEGSFWPRGSSIVIYQKTSQLFCKVLVFAVWLALMLSRQKSTASAAACRPPMTAPGLALLQAGRWIGCMQPCIFSDRLPDGLQGYLHAASIARLPKFAT